MPAEIIAPPRPRDPAERWSLFRPIKGENGMIFIRSFETKANMLKFLVYENKNKKKNEYSWVQYEGNLPDGAWKTLDGGITYKRA